MPKKHFSCFGIPCILTTDPGPQFTAGEFETFTKKWGIIHTQSSPGHLRANGKAEAAVRIAKYLLKKAARDGTDQNIALLELRNTPREDTGLSPAQMLFGCETRSVLPCFKCQHKSVVSEKRQKHKEKVKKYHHKGAKDLPNLSEGRTVYSEHKQKAQWILGKVRKVLSERTYQMGKMAVSTAETVFK